jgi:N-acetyl-anhydromuramyl-L-alanine amidase AmpD
LIALQRKLKTLGYRVYLTGIHDKQSVAAFLKFQRRNGLAESGMPDMETKELIEHQYLMIKRKRTLTLYRKTA